MSLITAESYCDVFDGLEGDGARYVVTGGVAIVLHGHRRPIADLDIVIDPAPQEANRALLALARRGFVQTIPLPPSMVSVLRMFDQSGREVDVFVRYNIPFNELWKDSERFRIGDHSVVRIASVAHLLRCKRTNGRPLDLQDIEGLLALEGRAPDSGVEPLEGDEREEPS